MGELKNRLLFYGLSISAYISPMLMIISIMTNYWLFSTEKITLSPQAAREKVSMATTTPQSQATPFHNSNMSMSTLNKARVDTTTVVSLYYTPLDSIEASYGLWRMCRVIDSSRQKRCEYIKYFQGSDSENRLTDTLKKQIGVCIVPILLALGLMVLSVMLHSYAFIRKKLHYLFLLSGCLFIFAGLASLTGLIVFIAAVNGAIDNKLTSKSKDDEPPFNYNYGFSFFCAVFSFLMQEFNGICNIYWYIDYYRKYRYEQENQNGLEYKAGISSSSNLNLSKSLMPTPGSNINLKLNLTTSNNNEISSTSMLHKMPMLIPPLPTLAINNTNNSIKAQLSQSSNENKTKNDENNLQNNNNNNNPTITISNSNSDHDKIDLDLYKQQQKPEDNHLNVTDNNNNNNSNNITGNSSNLKFLKSSTISTVTPQTASANSKRNKLNNQLYKLSLSQQRLNDLNNSLNANNIGNINKNQISSSLVDNKEYVDVQQLTANKLRSTLKSNNTNNSSQQNSSSKLNKLPSVTGSTTILPPPIPPPPNSTYLNHFSRQSQSHANDTTTSATTTTNSSVSSATGNSSTTASTTSSASTISSSSTSSVSSSSAINAAAGLVGGLLVPTSTSTLVPTNTLAQTTLNNSTANNVTINKLSKLKHETKIIEEDNELKSKFYKLKNESINTNNTNSNISPSNNSNNLILNKTNLNSNSYNKINDKILLKKYSSIDYYNNNNSNYEAMTSDKQSKQLKHMYQTQQQQQQQIPIISVDFLPSLYSQNQKQRQNSFRKAPKCFYYSHDDYNDYSNQVRVINNSTNNLKSISPVEKVIIDPKKFLNTTQIGPKSNVQTPTDPLLGPSSLNSATNQSLSSSKKQLNQSMPNNKKIKLLKNLTKKKQLSRTHYYNNYQHKLIDYPLFKTFNKNYSLTRLPSYTNEYEYDSDDDETDDSDTDSDCNSDCNMDINPLQTSPSLLKHHKQQQSQQQRVSPSQSLLKNSNKMRNPNLTTNKVINIKSPTNSDCLYKLVNTNNRSQQQQPNAMVSAANAAAQAAASYMRKEVKFSSKLVTSTGPSSSSNNNKNSNYSSLTSSSNNNSNLILNDNINSNNSDYYYLYDNNPQNKQSSLNYYQKQFQIHQGSGNYGSVISGVGSSCSSSSKAHKILKTRPAFQRNISLNEYQPITKYIIENENDDHNLIDNDTILKANTNMNRRNLAMIKNSQKNSSSAQSSKRRNLKRTTSV